MEKIGFEMHKKLLLDVIKRQAGTNQKALLEGVQNSLDANASKIEIIIKRNYFIIKDDGNGMTVEEIDKFFRVFGNSPKRGDENMIGQFGMGRGQMFAKAFVVWRTRKNLLIININNFVGYEQYKMPINKKGTTIYGKWFEPLRYDFNVSEIVNTLRSWLLKTDNVKIVINDKEIRRIKSENIIAEDDNFTAFYDPFLPNKAVYSQGLYIKKLDYYGDFQIHSKGKDKLNFARNDFLESPRTNKMEEFIKRVEESTIKSAKKFNDTEGRIILSRAIAGRIDQKTIQNKRLIQLTDGRMVSLEKLRDSEIFFGKEGGRLEDKAAQQGYTVISNLYKNLLSEGSKIAKNFNINTSKSQLRDMVSMPKFKEVKMKDLSKKSQVHAWAIQKMNGTIFYHYGDRKVFIGESSSAAAWTDGNSEIHIEKSIFKLNNRDKIHTKAFHLLCHEYCHDEDDRETEHHDANFYRKYHEMTMELCVDLIKFIGEWSYHDLKDDYELYGGN